MYTLLVVDDEEYAILGITKGIEWETLDIATIYTASNTQEAKEILLKTDVDIMISDIEMPGENGVSLLKWVYENTMNTKTIFLTGHADFHYAHKAMQYGCIEYLLKPVEYDVLFDVVKKTLSTIQKEKTQTLLAESYQTYKNLWETQKPTFAAHLWKDVLEGRLPGDATRLKEMMRVLEISSNSIEHITLVLIRIEHWLETLDAMDKEVMRFAVRNVAEETLLSNFQGVVFQLSDDTQMAVIYSGENIDCQIVPAAESFIEACNTHLMCHLSCYISEPTTMANAYTTQKSLFGIEAENLTKPNSILKMQNFKELTTSTLRAPDFSEWATLLSSGKTETLLLRMKEYLDKIYEGHASREMLESFCFGLISMTYHMLHQSGLRVTDAFPSKDTVTEGIHINSPQQAFSWAKIILDGITAACENTSKQESAMVREVKKFIEDHILQDFSREDIASTIHFNADYLSRVFKKETGSTLSDFIILRRMTTAQKMLEETADRIADIAHNLGYHHFSHFARQFRNVVGLTPQEYRMKHRKI